MLPAQTDVLVVGAGPTGLTVAATLARFASAHIKGKGGWPNRLRALQPGFRMAADMLAARGRKGARGVSNAASLGDLFTPKRDAR